MRQQRYTRIRALLAGGLVLGIGPAATAAAWTDQENASSTVQAGTFSLVSQTRDSPLGSHPAGSAASLGLDATGLYPGVSRAGWIQLRTSGTLGGTVTLTDVTATAPAGADQALLSALSARVFTVTEPTDCTKTATGGTSLPLTTIPTSAQLPPLAVQGNGANAVTYCVVLTLPLDASTSAQGGTVTPVWTFTGTAGSAG
jgi:predicted ribosomally synthesized peptide with SipW-like signal peptide